MKKLSSSWNDLDEIVLYGAGTVSKICADLFDKVNINIVYVIDKDPRKQGRRWNGVQIISFEQAQEIIPEKKIVVMTAHTAYNDISQFLESKGLREYEDYCGIGQFICEWFWYVKQMNCIYHVDMTITTRCTFNCKHCNMFIPYYREKKDYSFEELKKNVDLLFDRLDHIVYFGLIGGETMLSPSLVDILVYMGEHYKGRYGRISYTTNGSIIPSDRLLQVMKKYNVHLLVSDYTKEIPYSEKMKQLIKKLNEFEISYDVRYDQIWTNFGFPRSPVQRDEKELKEHLRCCHPEWNGLNDGKFYYCNIAWSAEKSGNYRLNKEDYIILSDIDVGDKAACHEIVKMSRGTSSFCRICGGCGNDNKDYVSVGAQL